MTWIKFGQNSYSCGMATGNYKPTNSQENFQATHTQPPHT